jgi:hypothetical protein
VQIFFFPTRVEKFSSAICGTSSTFPFPDRSGVPVKFFSSRDSFSGFSSDRRHGFDDCARRRVCAPASCCGHASPARTAFLFPTGD